MPLLGGPGDSLVPGTQPVSVMRIGAARDHRASRARSRSRWGCGSARAVKAATGDAYGDVILSGLTNGYSSYTATPEEYDACHYEGSFTLFGRRQGALYRDVAVAVAKALVDGHRLRGRPGARLPGRRERQLPRAGADAGRGHRGRAAREERGPLRPGHASAGTAATRRSTPRANRRLVTTAAACKRSAGSGSRPTTASTTSSSASPRPTSGPPRSRRRSACAPGKYRFVVTRPRRQGLGRRGLPDRVGAVRAHPDPQHRADADRDGPHARA